MNTEYATDKSTQHRSAQIYGVPAADLKDESRLVILYSGYKLGANEVRIPTSRVFQLRRDEILNEGNVTDYNIDGKQVMFYEVPLTAEVFETVSRKIHIGLEIASSSGGTLGGLVATTPSRPTIEQLEGVSVTDQLERTRRVATVMDESGVDAVVLARGNCGTIRQSYSWSGTLWVSLDENGADCDSLLM